MKTSEFEKIMDESGLEAEDSNGYIFINRYAAINEKIKIASISIEQKLEFNILRPFALCDKASDAIIEYAKTPIDERKDEIEATFFPSEIKFAKNTLNNLIISRSKIQKTEGNVNGVNHKFEVVFGNKDEFEMLLRILSKVSGTEMWP